MKQAIAITILLLVIGVAGCGPGEPDETRIRNAIESMAKGLEEGKPEPFLERVAEDFTGDRGAWDRQRVRQFVLGNTLRAREHPDIGLGDIEIELYDGRARATVTATIRGEDRWLPAGGARYRFETGWRLDDATWRIIRADWERLD